MALLAPWTLAQVRAEVMLRCTLNTGGDRGARVLGLVDTCIRRAVRELTASTPWLALAKTVEIPLTSEVRVYDFPDEMDPGRYMEVLVRHAETEKFIPLRPDPEQSLRNAFQESLGRPQAYWFDDGQLYLTPTPDTTYWDCVKIRGYLRPSDLVSDTDLVDIEGEAVVQRAELHLRPRVGQPVTPDMRESHFAYLRDLRGEQTENSGSMPGGDTSAKCVPQDGAGTSYGYGGYGGFAYDAGWNPPGHWGP